MENIAVGKKQLKLNRISSLQLSWDQARSSSSGALKGGPSIKYLLLRQSWDVWASWCCKGSKCLMPGSQKWSAVYKRWSHGWIGTFSSHLHVEHLQGLCKRYRRRGMQSNFTLQLYTRSADLVFEGQMKSSLPDVAFKSCFHCLVKWRCSLHFISFILANLPLFFILAKCSASTHIFLLSL